MAVKILFLDLASISPTVKQGHIMEEAEIEGMLSGRSKSCKKKMRSSSALEDS